MFRAKIPLHTFFQTVSKDPQSEHLLLATYLRRRTHDHPNFRIVFLRGRAPEILEPDIRYRQIALAPDVSRIRGIFGPGLTTGYMLQSVRLFCP